MGSGFDFDVIIRSLGYLFREGMSFTLYVTATATVIGTVLGTLIAVARLSGKPWLAKPAELYVNLVRALPLVLIIFWFYFLVPYVGQWLTGAERPVQVGATLSAVLTFILFEAAYFAEIMRAGIQSVPKGQTMAGRALGLSGGQVMMLIILPQAFRNMVPVLLTQTIILFQDTSLVYVLSITDFLGAAGNVAHRDNRLVEMYVFAALVYFVISLMGSLATRRLQSRLR